jgi:hypothetical protein
MTDRHPRLGPAQRHRVGLELRGIVLAHHDLISPHLKIQVSGVQDRGKGERANLSLNRMIEGTHLGRAARHRRYVPEAM